VFVPPVDTAPAPPDFAPAEPATPPLAPVPPGEPESGESLLPHAVAAATTVNTTGSHVFVIDIPVLAAKHPTTIRNGQAQLRAWLAGPLGTFEVLSRERRDEERRGSRDVDALVMRSTSTHRRESPINLVIATNQDCRS
jgi:hypothetical protein